MTPVAIAQDGSWRLPSKGPAAHEQEHGTLPAVDPLDGLDGSFIRTPAGVQIASTGASVDVCFPVLHGPGGEDGAIQGYLETMGVPYVGSGVSASAAAMHKHLAKPLLQASGVPVVPWLTVTADDVSSRLEQRVAHAVSSLGLPAFVKPSAQGSSVGVHKAASTQELSEAIVDAVAYDGVVLIEQAIDGAEIECAVLGNREPKASVLGHIEPCNEFYDYEAKYLAEGSVLTIPADLPALIAEKVRRLAVEAFTALGCSGLARVDFFVKGAEIWCNELNTMPGFTPISMYPKLWEATGIAYPRLLDELIELALERHARGS